MDFSFLSEYYPYFITGAVNTVVLAFFTVLFGVLIGIVVALMRITKNRLLRFIASAYVEFIRGTPLIVQIFIVYYGLNLDLPQTDMFGLDMSRFIPGIIAMSINSGAYVAEIIRAGIQAVDRGQMEAARSIGFTHAAGMRYIVLPQALRNILPALGNEFVVVIKESSIVSVIGIGELMYNATIVRGSTFKPFEPLIVAAVIYFVLTFTLSKFLGIAERRMRSSD